MVITKDNIVNHRNFNEDTFLKVMNGIPDLVSIHDKEMNIIYSNWKGFGDIPVERRVFNTKCYKAYRNIDEICDTCRAKEIIKTKKAFSVDAQIENNKWVNVRVIPLLNENGDCDMYIELVRDITERKHNEIELKKHRSNLEELVIEKTDDLETINNILIDINKEAKMNSVTIEQQNLALNKTIQNLKMTQAQLIESEKMASLGVLTAGVAHEINNPLNFIMGGYEGIEKFFKANEHLFDDNIKMMLNSIKQGVEKSTSIVNSLNEFSRNNVDFNEECDINYIIDNSILMVQNKLNERITIRKNYESEKMLVMGNSGRLHQVFINIIINAIDSIEEQGEIIIETKKINNKVNINIKDNGCGIKNEDFSKITTPFFTTKEPGKGTGLGLSITSNIIKEHKGSLNFESEVNKGTTVCIVIDSKYDQN